MSVLLKKPKSEINEFGGRPNRDTPKYWRINRKKGSLTQTLSKPVKTGG